jgi:hypothetical protein
MSARMDDAARVNAAWSAFIGGGGAKPPTPGPSMRP